MKMETKKSQKAKIHFAANDSVSITFKWELENKARIQYLKVSILVLCFGDFCYPQLYLRTNMAQTIPHNAVVTNYGDRRKENGTWTC